MQRQPALNELLVRVVEALTYFRLEKLIQAKVSIDKATASSVKLKDFMQIIALEINTI